MSLSNYSLTQSQINAAFTLIPVLVWVSLNWLIARVELYCKQCYVVMSMLYYVDHNNDLFTSEFPGVHFLHFHGEKKRNYTQQESWAIAKMTARCALYK